MEAIAAFALSRREVERHFRAPIIVEEDPWARPGPMGYLLLAIDGEPRFILEVHYGLDEPDQESLLFGLMSQDLREQRELFLLATGIDHRKLTSVRAKDDWIPVTPDTGP